MKKIAHAVLGLLLACGSVHASRLLPSLGSFNKYKDVGYAGLWGHTAADGKEYALLGVRSGLSIVDITQIGNPQEVAFIPNIKNSIWTEVKSFKNYAYVVKDSVDVGLQIIDLSDLPHSAKVVKTITAYPKIHTLWIDDKQELLFLNGGSGHNTKIFTLKDPANPVEISSFLNNPYVHDMFVRGNRAYLSEIMSQSFSIYDIGDILNPKLIKRVYESTAPYVSFHNSWTTDDGRYLVTTEETSNRPVRIWDIQDELNPKEVGRYLGPGAIAHNVRILGRYIHIAHYGGGYRVVDMSNPAVPVEVAFFNPKSTDQRGMVGVWDVYPYFASGKVIMSSIEDGLYVTEFKDR